MDVWKSVQGTWTKVRDVSKSKAGLIVRTGVVAVSAALIAKDMIELSKEQSSSGGDRGGPGSPGRSS